MSEKNIDSLCKAIKKKASLVSQTMFISSFNVVLNVKSADDVLDFKFNILKFIIEKHNIIGLESYKDFFKNSDAPNDLNNQKETNQSKIERVGLDDPVDDNGKWVKLVFNNLFFMKEFGDKVQLSDVKEAIEDKQKLNANNGFIKICKGIYKFTYGFPENSKDSAKILSYALNQFAKHVNKWAINEDNLQYVFEHIQDIRCEDEEFKGFKERLEYCVYDEQTETFEVNESKTEEKKETIVNNSIRVPSSTASQNETDEEFKGFKERLEYCFYDKENKEFKEFEVNEDKCKPIETEKNEEIVDNCKRMRFSPPIANQDEPSEEKISTKKLFLLIATVIFLAAVIFFTINLILGFLAISQTLAIILAAIATIALVIFLAIGIKNDVINKPQCLGGEKSFIDFYQNKGEMEKEPEPYKNIEEEYDKKSDEDSEK